MSVQIDGTSQLNSTGGGGQIIVTGYNDVVFDGVFGTGSHELAVLELNAEHGNLTIPKTSGRIESDARIVLKGAVVDVQGVVESTFTTADLSDFEITIDASDRAIINGDLRLTGSMKIAADNLVEVFNTTLAVTELGQRIVFAGGAINFGKASVDGSGNPVQLGALVTAADRIEFQTTGLVRIGSGSVIATSGTNSVIELNAGGLEIAGSLLAGATISGTDVVYDGIGADIVIHSTDMVDIGGQGIIAGVAQKVGGTLVATGNIVINVEDGPSDISFSISAFSTLRTQTATAEPADAAHSISINAAQDIQIYSAITALQVGADITLNSDELILVDGLLDAADQLTVIGGSDETGAGLILPAFVFETDGTGDLVLDGQGNPVRLQGGTLRTAVGGSIILGADDKLVLSGVVGETFVNESGVEVATTATIDVVKGGNVIVTTTLNAADRIKFLATDITLVAGSVIHTLGIDGVVDLRGTGNFTMASNDAETAPALIQASSLVHLLGGIMSLDGQILASGGNGRVVINAVDSVTFFGEVMSSTTLDVRSGVAANNSDESPWNALSTMEDLIGGDVVIHGGTLTANDASSILAGHDVTVVGASTVGDTPVVIRTPVIVTNTQTIEVITGTRQIATGAILVPEISFVTTTVTEQVGTESVRVGSEYNTANVKLTQLGYYKPGQTLKKTFIEGIDYVWKTSPSAGYYVGSVKINWNKVYDNTTGLEVTITGATPVKGTAFANLTANQADSLFIALGGYRPFYNATFEALTTNTTISGIPTTSTWLPDWQANYSTKYVDTYYENSTVKGTQNTRSYYDYTNTEILIVATDGFRDKWVEVPVGAVADLERMVSQGGTATFQEDVGNTWEQANVLYNQIKSANTASTSGDSRNTDFDGE